MKHRKPRPPAPATGLPDTHVEFEEDLIIRTVRMWWEFKGPLLTAESTHADFEAGFFDMLTHPEDAEDAALVVQVAKGGHPAADQALRRFIRGAIEADKFQQMPVSVRNYTRETVVDRGPLSGYPPRSPQITAHYGRDIAIAYCVDRVRAKYPAVPLYKEKKHRKSAAYLVGKAFGGLSEIQVRRIHEAGGRIAVRLAEFFLWPVGELEHST